MKNYIYNLFAVLIAATTFTACSAEEGTDVGNDPVPSVIIYQYKPGASYNADNDIALRFATNNKTSEAYYLVEKTSEKKEHIASMGETGYMDYIISNGEKIEGISGESSADVILTGLIGEYRITAVAVNGKQKTAFESVFNGLQWDLLGTGTLTTEFFGSVTVQRQFYQLHNENSYKVASAYENGYDIILKTDDKGNVTIDKQGVYSSYGDYGVLYIAGTGIFQEGQFVVTATFSVSLGSFGDTTEIFTLPTEK